MALSFSLLFCVWIEQRQKWCDGAVKDGGGGGCDGCYCTTKYRFYIHNNFQWVWIDLAYVYLLFIFSCSSSFAIHFYSVFIGCLYYIQYSVCFFPYFSLFCAHSLNNICVCVLFCFLLLFNWKSNIKVYLTK